MPDFWAGSNLLSTWGGTECELVLWLWRRLNTVLRRLVLQNVFRDISRGFSGCHGDGGRQRGEKHSACLSWCAAQSSLRGIFVLRGVLPASRLDRRWQLPRSSGAPPWQTAKSEHRLRPLGESVALRRQRLPAAARMACHSTLPNMFTRSISAMTTGPIVPSPPTARPWLSNAPLAGALVVRRRMRASAHWTKALRRLTSIGPKENRGPRPRAIVWRRSRPPGATSSKGA